MHTVFRTNSSYARWDDARKMWGKMINRSRDIVRMAATWYGDESAGASNGDYGHYPGLSPSTRINGLFRSERERSQKLSHLSKTVWSFSRSLARHLTPPHEDEEAFQQDIRAVLDPEQAEALIAADHRPNRAMFDIGVAINRLPMHFLRKNQIDLNVALFEDIAGGCERIFSSPVPLVYSRHTARFLALYLIFLPLGLWEPYSGSWNSIAMIPAVALISLFLMGISELAISLEEPFSILPLQAISEKIRVNCNEIATWDTALPIPPRKRPGQRKPSEIAKSYLSHFLVRNSLDQQQQQSPDDMSDDQGQEPTNGVEPPNGVPQQDQLHINGSHAPNGSGPTTVYSSSQN